MQQRKWKTMPSRIRENNFTKQATVNAMLHPQALSWGLNDSLQLLGVLPVYTPHQELPLAENGCFFQSHVASIQWVIDIRSEGLISSSALWKAIPAPELWLNFLSPCLECITNQLLQLPPSSLLSPFLSPKALLLKALPQNSLYANLHLRTTFWATKPQAKKIWNTARQFHCEEILILGMS